MTDHNKEIQRVKVLLPKYHAMPHTQRAVRLKPGESRIWEKLKNEREIKRQKLNAPRENCKAEGCTRASHSLGYCVTHYNRVKAHGDPQVHIPIKQLNFKNN